MSIQPANGDSGVFLCLRCWRSAAVSHQQKDLVTFFGHRPFLGKKNIKPQKDTETKLYFKCFESVGSKSIRIHCFLIFLRFYI